MIAIPQVIKILNKARISAAEDTTSGIVKSAENYVADFMLKNKGIIPNDVLIFDCNKTGCSLTNTLENYNLEGLTELDFKGTKPSSGKIMINNDNQKISVVNLEVNGYICNYPVNGKVECKDKTTDDVDSGKELLENKNYETGDKISLAGYDWHVISDYNNKVTLLMDWGQVSNMAHCTYDTDISRDCGATTFVMYSWDKSLIRNYLNNTLYFELKAKIANELVPTKICIDPSMSQYGGYLEDEMNMISDPYSTCKNGYVEDYIRLITYSEFWNLSPNYTGTNDLYPNTSGITRLSSANDYTNWLYCESEDCGDNSQFWWTMQSASCCNSDDVRYAGAVKYNGYILQQVSWQNFGVRPVITIEKK